MFNQIKYVVLGAIGLVLVATGFFAAKWWYECDVEEAIERAYEADAGLQEDNKETEIVYVDRIVTVTEYVEKSGSADLECLTPDLVGVFNGGM